MQAGETVMKVGYWNGLLIAADSVQNNDKTEIKGTNCLEKDMWDRSYLIQLETWFEVKCQTTVIFE